MRRRPGVSGLQRKLQAKEQFQALGEQAKQIRKEEMKRQMATFKTSLEEFALSHKQDIRRDPVFRAQFQTMCANIGVDPLSSNKGYWAKVLGFGDFYYELGVQIVEVCMATRSLNGGLIDLDTLLKHVQRRRGSAAEPVSHNDITTAIKKLKVLGNGFNLVLIGQQTLIRSVPGELNTDKNKVLELAQEKGYVSREEVEEKTGWTRTRTAETLEGLLKESFALIDDGSPDHVRLFWFPCVREFS